MCPHDADADTCFRCVIDKNKTYEVVRSALDVLHVDWFEDKGDAAASLIAELALAGYVIRPKDS